MRPRGSHISITAARWMIAGEWRHHPGRVIVAALAIAIGVALGFAVHLINASALNEFTRALRTVNGEADLQVRSATPFGFREDLYPALARLDGIANASPVVELPASIGPGARASLTLIGLDVLRAVDVTPALIGLGAAEQPFAGGSLFLSQAALARSGAQVGDMVEIYAAGQLAAFRVTGTLPGAGEDQEIGVIDIAEAQWRFGQLGRLQRIDLRLAEGADPEAVRAAIAAILPADAEIVTPESEARRGDNLSRAYRVNLDMLALVALLTGSLLVFTAQSLSVTRRWAQFALLRVLGMHRRAVLAQVLAEGAIVGIVGAGMGLVLGLVLADTALGLLGGDLGGGFFSGTQPELIFAPWSAAAFFALGLAAALAGSFVPAREAARALPAVALKNASDADDPKAFPLARTSLALLAAGAGSAMLPAVAGLPLFGYLAIGLMLAGGITAMPLLARVLLAPLQRLGFSAPALGLALKRLWGAPSQAAVALCSIVASTGLMVAMAVMVSSFRYSVDEWLTEILPADIYIYVQGAGAGGLDRPTQERLRRIAGVEDIAFFKRTSLTLSPELPPLSLVAREIDPDPRQTLPLIGPARAVPDGATPVWISEPAAWLYGWRPGDRIDLPIAVAGGKAEHGFFVAGLWRDYSRQHGAIAIEDADYTRLTGDELRTEAAVTLATGFNAPAVIDDLRAALPEETGGRVAFALPNEIRAEALQAFDRSFAVTYVLELVAILVGLSGVAATFSAQTLARAKEFGMLRHIGVLRRQIMAMLAVEGALLGSVGVVAGIGLGLAMSQVLIHVINPQSFHWTMETRLPFGLFAAVFLGLIASGALTALLAGRRALSQDAVRAVREDW